MAFYRCGGGGSHEVRTGVASGVVGGVTIVFEKPFPTGVTPNIYVRLYNTDASVPYTAIPSVAIKNVSNTGFSISGLYNATNVGPVSGSFKGTVYWSAVAEN